jgi:PhnB protein
VAPPSRSRIRARAQRFTDEEGRVTHAELELEGATVMLGWPGPTYRGPKRHAEECGIERAVGQTPFVVDGVLVYVKDVDRHLEGARDAGARILREIEDEPFGRLYVAEDVEGHRWMFPQPS